MRRAIIRFGELVLIRTVARPLHRSLDHTVTLSAVQGGNVFSLGLPSRPGRASSTQLSLAVKNANLDLDLTGSRSDLHSTVLQEAHEIGSVARTPFDTTVRRGSWGCYPEPFPASLPSGDQHTPRISL